MDKIEKIKRVENFISALYESLDDSSNQEKQEYIDNINYDIDTLEGILDLYEKDEEKIQYYEDILDALNEYYSISIEDIEKCIKEDK